MSDKFEPYAREVTQIQPDRDFTIWCPFCDDWRLTDSMVARKKLGLHIANMHNGEVRFKAGQAPPALENI